MAEELPSDLVPARGGLPEDLVPAHELPDDLVPAIEKTVNPALIDRIVEGMEIARRTMLVPKFIADAPREMISTTLENLGSVRNLILPKSLGGEREPAAEGVLPGLEKTAEAFLGIASIPFSPAQGALRSMIGHPMVAADDLLRRGAVAMYGEDKVAEVEKEMGRLPGPLTYEDAKHRVDVALMAMMPRGFSRMEFGAMGEPQIVPVGGIPKAEDFSNAAKAVGGNDAPPSVRDKLIRLYDERGIHPAEVAHDAEHDPTIAQTLLSSGKDMPERYGAPTTPPTEIAPVQGSKIPEGASRAELAKTGVEHIDAILDSPVTKHVIDNPVIDRDHTIPYTAGGSVPLEDPTVFIDRRFPRSFTIDGVTFDPADPFVIHENVEQHTMELLIKGGMAPEEAYRVAHFEFAEKAEGAWYKAHGINQAKAEAAYAPYMAKIQHEGATNVPDNLYKRTYPHDNPSAATREPIAEAGPTADEISRAKAILASAPPAELIEGGGGGGTVGPPFPASFAGEPERFPAGSLATARKAILDKLSIGEADPSRKLTWSRLYTAIVDKMFPIFQAVKRATEGEGLPTEENPAHLARLLSGVAGKADHMLNKGTFDFRTYENNGPSLKEILDPVKDDLDNFRAFAAAARAAELERRNIKSGLDRESILRVGRSGIGQYGPVLEELVNYQNRVAAYLRDSGVISHKAYNAMLEANRLYVPFNRVMDAEGLSSIRGPGGTLQAANPIKAIKGSLRDIVDPIENVVRNTYLFTQMAEKNVVGVKLVDMLKRAAAEQTPGDAKPPSQLPVAIDKATHNAATEWLGEHGATAGVTDLADVIEAAAQPAREGEVSIFRNGKRETYRVDPDLARAMKGLDATSVGVIEKLLSLPANTLRAGAVTTPDFALRHSIRDFIYAAITTTEGIFSPIDMARGFIGLISKDRDFWNWMKGGGGNVSMVSLDRRYLQENLEVLTEKTGLMTRAWNVVADPEASWLHKAGAVIGLPFQAIGKFIIHPLQVLTELAESASHLGAYKKAIQRYQVDRETRTPPAGTTLPALLPEAGLPAEAGLPTAPPLPPSEALKRDILRAAWVSRDTAVDAARIGASTRAYNMITAFANITIQDTDRIARAFINDPAGTGLKVGAAIVLPSALLWWANHDDPRYGEIPQWERDMFWIILTQNHIFRIPKPFGVGVLFGSGTERALEAFFSQNPEAFKNWAKSIKDTVVPQFVPTAAAPIVNQFANRSTFTNRTLIPSDLEKYLPEYQYTPYTSEMAKAMGRIIGAFPGVREEAIRPDSTFGGVARALTSPILVENYIRGWSGNLGMYALSTADAALRKSGVLPDPVLPASTLADIPVIKAFTVRYPSASAESIQTFNDDYAANKKYYDTWLGKAKDGDNEAVARIEAAGGPRMFVQLDGIKTVLTEHSQLIRDVYKDPKTSAAEKRQLIDQLYYSMIQVAQYGRQSMKQVDEALARRAGQQ